ncbi:MAG TPA: MFS transporter, partial [Paludibacter sp.]|nr:MFS transporter [Paludibacter sp.]
MPVFRNKWTPLFLSNFLGVYNDNLLKNCIIFISIGWALPGWLTQSQLISLVSASLVVPYLFLSPLAGRLAVIYSKKSVFRFFKLLEIPVLAIACVAFHFKWVMVAVSAVFAMGILSCLYSPSKYSLIRDIGGEPGVSFGSGVFEMMAFLGILIGTVTASVVSDHYQPVVVYVLFMGLAALGYFSTRSIEANELPEDEPTSSLNPFSFLKNSYLYARQHSGVNA